MLRSWIQYNKPEEPSFTHAGLLFALGLHGHLKVLATTDAYRYLSEVESIFLHCLLFIIFFCFDLFDARFVILAKFQSHWQNFGHFGH